MASPALRDTSKRRRVGVQPGSQGTQGEDRDHACRPRRRHHPDVRYRVGW